MTIENHEHRLPRLDGLNHPFQADGRILIYRNGLGWQAEDLADAFTGGALTAAMVADRTRSQYLPITTFAAIVGSPAKAQVGSAAGVTADTFAWAFDGAALETIQHEGLVVLPADINSTSTVTVRLHWAPSDGTAGNVYWRLEYAFIDTNDQIDEAIATVNAQTASPAVADQRTTTDLTTAAKTADDILMKVNISRVGNDALDTYDSLDAWLAAVELRYTADS